MFDAEAIETAKTYLNSLKVDYMYYDKALDRHTYLMCQVTRITPQYGNRLGVRVSGGTTDHDARLVEIADLEAQLPKLKKYIEDKKASIKMVMSMANLSAKERIVIRCRYGQIVRTYAWMYRKGYVSSIGDAQYSENKGLEKIGFYLMSQEEKESEEHVL